MNEVISSWWGIMAAYAVAPASIASGEFGPFSVIPALGLVALVVGVVLAAVQREKQARWMVGVVVLAAASPIALRFFNSILGWMGMTLAIIAGALALLVLTGVIANEATHRRPSGSSPSSRSRSPSLPGPTVSSTPGSANRWRGRASASSLPKCR